MLVWAEMLQDIDPQLVRTLLEDPTTPETLSAGIYLQWTNSRAAGRPHQLRAQIWDKVSSQTQKNAGEREFPAFAPSPVSYDAADAFIARLEALSHSFKPSKGSPAGKVHKGMADHHDLCSFIWLSGQVCRWASWQEDKGHFTTGAPA